MNMPGYWHRMTVSPPIVEWGRIFYAGIRDGFSDLWNLASFRMKTEKGGVRDVLH